MKPIEQISIELIEKLSELFTHNLDHFSLPEMSDDPISKDSLQILCSALINEGQHHSSKLWAAHMTPSASADSLIGQILACLHNGNLLSPQLYPILSQIEQQLIGWFCSLFQQQYGHFTAGSTYANLEALWHAREHSSHDSNIVYGSTATHYSIIKACQILGLSFQAIATDSYDRIDPQALEQACQHQTPIAIILTAGTSACGEFDPLAQCLAISERYHCWSHIDAAWGGALILLSEYQDLFSVVAKSDSLSFDPHKSLHQPKSSGILLYQRPLKPMLMADANYLEHQPQQTLPGSYGGELFLPLWMTIMSSGIGELRQNIRHRLQQAELFATELKIKTDWWVHHAKTGIVCFQITGDADLKELIIKGIFSRAKINNKHVYRAVFASNATQASALINVLRPYF